MTEQPPPGLPPSAMPFPVPPSTPWETQGPWGVVPTPGTVQAAAIITYISAAISIAMTLAIVALAALLGSIGNGVFVDSFGRSDVIQVGLILLGTAVLTVLASALACWFAWQTTKRKPWARIALASCAGLAVVLGVLTMPFGLINALAAVAVLVLLFVPASNDWFQSN